MIFKNNDQLRLVVYSWQPLGPLLKVKLLVGYSTSSITSLGTDVIVSFERAPTRRIIRARSNCGDQPDKSALMLRPLSSLAFRALIASRISNPEYEGDVSGIRMATNSAFALRSRKTNLVIESAA